jgi:hypothetical protein
MLEKAQDRKKKVNLEEPNGISHNPFSVLSSEIYEIALDTGIILGNNEVDRDQTILEIVEKDKERILVFEKTCSGCHIDNDVAVDNVDDHGVCGGDDPCTPVAQIIVPLMGDRIDGNGQWTLIGNRKQSKPKVSS